MEFSKCFFHGPITCRSSQDTSQFLVLDYTKGVIWMTNSSGWQRFPKSFNLWWGIFPRVSDLKSFWTWPCSSWQNRSKSKQHSHSGSHSVARPLLDTSKALINLCIRQNLYFPRTTFEWLLNKTSLYLKHSIETKLVNAECIRKGGRRPDVHEGSQSFSSLFKI